MNLPLPEEDLSPLLFMIFLAFSILKVVFNLGLTGTNSLEMDFKVKIIWFL